MFQDEYIILNQSKEDPKNIAEFALKEVAPHLKIKPDLTELKFDKVKKSILPFDQLG